MVRTKIQRHTDPVVVQQLWNSILYIRQQKQISNRDRIRRYMQRSHDLKFAETDKHLDNAVSDGLIGQYTAVGFKGCRVGLEQDGFRMPDIESDFEKGDHDWYCFECHKPGEVLLCSECWRVYHLGCTTQDTSGPTFVCQVCKVTKKKQRMKRKELNRLLGYTVNRLKEKWRFCFQTKELHKLFTREEEENFARFVYLPMDLNTMEQKVRERKYRYLEQFKADAQVIFHNVVICYTVDKQYAANLEHGGMAELVKIMVRDCAYDLDEIKQCKDCYNFSNAKPKDWFCQPCRPPHELVYAKQKGFSHWPAKVIKVTPQGYDVRFFGGWHQRAVIQESSVKPIDVNLKTLNIKKTSGFTKACEELRRHQVLLEQQKETLDTAADEEEDLDDDEEDEPPPPPPKPKKKKEKKKKIRIEEEDGFDLFEEPKPKAKKRKVEREVDDEYTEIKPIKRKKHRPKVEEQQDSISTSSVPDKPASTPEDVNLVTSSEDNYHPPRSITTTESSTQTSKKMTSANRHPHKSTQTDLEIASTNCNCEEKYTKIFSDLKSSLETTHEQDKEKALKELAERLQKDFEEDKQQAVSRAMSNVQREVDRTRRKAEERVKEQYMEEMKQLALKHKAEISTTKKKQWCYNCEEEAMYHCCWNTSYCSVKCQQEHWGKEHKRTCRRKR